MIEFIYGPPCSGKTVLLYEKIKETLKSGGDAVLIVPDQEALDAEAALARVCRDVPTLKLRVYGFSRLADEVFRKYGGISYNYADKTGQKLAAYLAIRSVAPALKVYGKTNAADGSLLGSVLSAIKEFKRQGVDLKELEEAARSVDSAALKDKLDDLSLIIPAYDTILKKSGDDPDNELARMYRLLSEKGGMPDADIFIDSFISFTGVQMKIIELFMRTCKSVTVTFGIPAPAGSDNKYDLLSPVYDSEKRLSAAASRCGGFDRTILDKSYVSPCMSALEKGLRTGEISAVKADDNVRFFRAHTAFDEAEFVASDIAKKLREGCRCRDIAILCSSVSSWRGITDAALEKYKIPYFISVRENAAQKALFRLIIFALHVCINNFRTKDVSSYIKTGLLRVGSDPLDMFDDYITRRNIRGVKAFTVDFTGSPYSYGAPDEHDERAVKRLSTVNEVRAAVITPLYDLYTELQDCGDAKSISKAIVRLLQRIEITETLGKLVSDAKANGDTAEAETVSQLWDVFVSISTQLCTVCGDIPMNAAVYTQLFETVLSDTDIGRIPTSTDQVVIGESGMLRVHNVKHVYLMGCNEGEFPSSVTDTGIFSDDERQKINDAGILLEGTSDKENERKIYDFYRCATSSSESAAFSYSVSTAEGNEKYPCHLITEIQRIFPDAKTVSELSVYDIAASAESAYEYYAANKDTKEGRMIKKLLLTDTKNAEKAKLLDTPIVSHNEKLGKETAKKLIPGSVKLSPTRLSSFTDCAFAHCCKYFLKLEPDNAVDFNAKEFGSFVHYVLKRLIDDRMKGVLPEQPDEKQLSDAVDKYVKEYCEIYLRINTDADGMGRFRASVRKLKKCTVKVADDILKELAAGRFTPVATELKISDSFGMTPYAIELPNGKKAYLTGTIDRVDAYKHNGKTYIKLADYKTGDVKFDLSALAEADKTVQLFAYMLTVCTSAGMFEDPTPAALFYMETVPDQPVLEGSGAAPDGAVLNRGGIALSDQDILDALEPGMDKKGGSIYKTSAGGMVFAAPEQMTAVFDEVKTAISDAAERMCEGDASVTEKQNKVPCDYCPYINICRRTDKKTQRRS